MGRFNRIPSEVQGAKAHGSTLFGIAQRLRWRREDSRLRSTRVAALFSLVLLVCASLTPAAAIHAEPVRPQEAAPVWPATAPAPNRVAGEGETWFVSWTATAAGHLDGPYGDDGHIERTHTISMQGSAIARYSIDNSGTRWATKPFQWTVTDDLYEKTTTPCSGGGSSVTREHTSITAPNTPPVWVDDFVVPGEVFEHDDGSKYMQGFWFVHSNDGMPWLPYQTDYYSRYCRQDSSSSTKISDESFYAGVIWFEAYKGGLNIFDMDCDTTGTSCWWDYSFTGNAGSDMPMPVHWSVRAHRLPDSPSITQKPELLENNVFLPGVPVDDTFAGNLECDNGATCQAKRRLQSPSKAAQQENIGPAASGNYPKTINLGALPPGQSLLTAQAQGSTPAPPDSRTINIAAKLPAWAANIAGIIAHKVGDYVAYIWEVKFPSPAIKKTWPVPAIVPFIGGKKAGVEMPQTSLKTEAKSTGEVSLQGTTGGALILGDSQVGIKVGGKANGVLDLQGVRNVKGEAEFKVFGKVSAKESLVKAVPALRPAITAIEQFSPAVAEWLENRAKAQLEIEPNWAGIFAFSDKTGSIAIDNATIAPAIGIKVKALLQAFEGVLEGAVGVGGEVKAKLPTPPLSLKEVTINFLVIAEGVLMHFGFNEQAGYTCTFPPGTCATAGGGAVTAAGTTVWTPNDRSYLDDADYGRWTATESAQTQAAAVDAGNAATANNVVDIQLADNIYPQAHPTLARNGSQRMLLWSHDAPGKAATSAQELRFSRRTNSSNESWSASVAITNDDFADFNRELVFAPDGDGVAVWQRFDSSTPGDMNTDPQAYLSHVQIAASNWNGTSWSAPLQLSASGSTNMRPSLTAVTKGAIAVWIGNASNQLIGDATHPDTIYSAVYTDTTATWGAATPVLSNVSGLLGLHVVGRGDHAAIVYSRDLDGDFATDSDRELFYILWNNGWGAETRLTNNQVADEAPLLAWAKDGTPQLVWQQGDKLLLLNGTWNSANAQTLPFANPGSALQLVNDLSNQDQQLLALSWAQVTGSDTRIGYAVYDGAQNLWGNPQTMPPPVTSVVTDTSTMVTHISSAMEGTRLIFAYEMAEVKATTAQVGDVAVPNVPQSGKSSLRYAEITLEANLAIAENDIVVTPLDAGPGQRITISAAVHNTGALPTAAPTSVNLVEMKDFTTYSQPLHVITGGDVVTVSFPYTQPLESAGMLEMRVDPGFLLDENDTSDNKVNVVTAPLFTTIPTIDTPLGPRVGARFQQQGAIQGDISVTATLHLDSESGPIVGEALAGFPDTPVMQVVTTTVVLSPTQLGQGQHLIYWVGTTGFLGVSAANVYADLALYPELVIVNGNQISATVANQGNLASQGGVLQIYNQDPSTPGAQPVMEIPIPSIPPGQTASVGGVVAGAGSLFYVVLKPPTDDPDFNPSNNVAVIGELVPSQTPSNLGLLLPFVTK